LAGGATQPYPAFGRSRANLTNWFSACATGRRVTLVAMASDHQVPPVNPWGAAIHEYEEVDSTNRVARELAEQGASHGTVVAAQLQTAGRGRQGRAWLTPPGALALSVVVRPAADPLLPLRAGLAVARVAGSAARVKWPNDVLIDGRKVAGILVESAGDAAILGIGLNAAVEVAALPAEVASRAGSLGRDRGELDELRTALLEQLHIALSAAPDLVLAALAARDALAGVAVRWTASDGADQMLAGVAQGCDASGRLQVRADDGELHLLSGGEVHLL
jgi:BirA family transcriptional regulator, biotin operon repressor / biotin---[acetyl-CoA-carboxylase] ligase